MASCSVPFPAVMPSSLQRLNQLLYFFLCHDYVTVFVLMICQRAVGFTWGPGWKRLPCVKICMHRHQHQTSQQTVECWLSMCAMFSVVVGLHVAVLGQSGSGCCGTLNATDRQTNRKTGPFIQGFHGISARCSSLMATAVLMLTVNTDLDTEPGSIQLPTSRAASRWREGANRGHWWRPMHLEACSSVAVQTASAHFPASRKTECCFKNTLPRTLRLGTLTSV